ncbi:MAG: transglutaminase [Bacillales bacterium]|jgi:transglutaminase-like putative cysteine protease|nr:transglutaminase [Bacillales bacterium]
MDKHKVRIPRTIQMINYALLFILIWQCLLPLNGIATKEVLSAYIFFTFLSIVFYTFGIKKYISFPILTIYALYVTFNEFYKGQSDFLGHWIQLFLKNITKNIDLLINGTWDSYSSPFNTFIFFYVLYAITSALHVWIRNRWSMLPVSVCTISIIAVLGEFYDYNAKNSFIRVVIVGVVLIVLTNALRFSKKEHFELDVVTTLRWVIPSVIILALGIGLGFAGPKQEAQWSDPIAVIKELDWFGYGSGKGDGAEGASKMATTATSGYDVDASELGGNLEADDSIAFIATDGMSHYWKIDDLNTYTGQGWINNADPVSGTSNTLTPTEHTVINDSIVVDGLEEEKYTNSSISIKTKLTRLPYPYPYREVKVNILSKKKGGLWYQADYENKIFSVTPKSGDSFTNAEYQYKLIEFDIDKLKKVALKSANSFSQDLLYKEGGTVDPNAVPDVYSPDSRYVQLPEGFSHRVKMLAVEITKDIPNDYDKIKAIEDYLKNGDFEYSLTGVPDPKKNQDYVDQFLFDSKKGYCDNFSSAFVILCRSLNFQARWVRGFNEGTFKKGELDKKIFEITNLDAHSWGEVYFNEYGWVPFEPTPGFTNDSMFKKTSEITYPNSPEQPNPINKPNKPTGSDDLGPENKPKSDKGPLSSKDLLLKYSKIVLYIVGILGLLGAILYPIRGKFMPIIWIFIFKRVKGESAFPKAYHVLLKQLERCKLKRKPGITLREHSKYVDQYFHTLGIMEQLTLEYEKYMYRGNIESITKDKWHAKWERIMRCTLNM